MKLIKWKKLSEEEIRHQFIRQQDTYTWLASLTIALAIFNIGYLWMPSLFIIILNIRRYVAYMRYKKNDDRTTATKYN